MPKYQHYEQKKRELFLDRLAAILQTKRKMVEQLLSIDRLQSLRYNPLSGVPQATVEQAMSARGWQYQAIEWCSDGYFVDTPKSQISDDELVTSGQVFIQNAASFVPALALAPQPDQKILDMNAAPGGKASHIAALSDNQAQLWVNDIDFRRIKKMKQVFEILQVKPSMVLNQPAQHLPETIDDQFDAILLDAQCSGEGLIDLRLPRAMKYWSLARINKFVELQKMMIIAAYQLLKPGGVLVYSTCTFAPEENEGIIQHLLNRESQAEVVPIQLAVASRMPGLIEWQGHSFDNRLSQAVRLVPTPYTEGFFICKLRKPA